MLKKVKSFLFPAKDNLTNTLTPNLHDTLIGVKECIHTINDRLGEINIGLSEVKSPSEREVVKSILTELKLISSEIKLLRRSSLPFTYLDIDGWFDFEDLYIFLVNQLREGDVCLELGCWKGKSIAFLGAEIKSRRLDCKIYAVDTWKGILEIKDSQQEFQNQLELQGEDIFHLFQSNIKAVGLDSVIIPIQNTSISAAHVFTDKLRFIFIDADHSYEAVLQDIDAWIKHVKPDGFVAGHDIGWTSVKKAVDERFYKYKVIGSSWLATVDAYKAPTVPDNK